MWLSALACGLMYMLMIWSVKAGAAALPNLQLARALLVSGECEHVLSVCVEVSSAAMYLDNEPGVLISACLFGDGAGAAILSRDPAAGGRIIEWIDSTSLIDQVNAKR
jgi:3-oxoacyl-[acyl-carrier-protein] synthase III